MKFIVEPFAKHHGQRNCPTKGPCPLDWCKNLYYIIPVGP